MRAIVYIAVLALGMASLGIATAAEPQERCAKAQMAQGNHPEVGSGKQRTHLAQGAHPNANTNARATQLAQGMYPGAKQYAAARTAPCP